MWCLSFGSRLWIGGLAGVVALIGLLLGCSAEADDSSSQAVIHGYTVRGRIVQLPDPSNPVSELSIHHEAIDDFKLGDGTPEPMRAMTMPFPPADGVSLQGLEVGDVVEFSFEVQWEPSPGMSLTAIKKLPEDAVLGFDESSSGHMDHDNAVEH